MKYYLNVLQNYAVFNGRANRAEFWYFFLYHLLIAFVLGRIGAILTIDLLSIYFPAMLIPSIAVSVRRMHDAGKSGWYALIPFYNIVLAVSEGTKGENKYGNPHAAFAY